MCLRRKIESKRDEEIIGCQRERESLWYRERERKKRQRARRERNRKSRAMGGIDD